MVKITVLSEQVGTLYVLWWICIVMLSLPFVAIAYVLGMLAFFVQLGYRAAYRQAECFPKKISVEDE